MFDDVHISEEPEWRLYPRLLLRRAGFPFELLAGLADETAVQASDRHRACVQRFEEERERLLRQLIPAAVEDARTASDRVRLAWLSSTRSLVGRRRPATPAGDAVLGEALGRYDASLRAEADALGALHEAGAGHVVTAARVDAVLADPMVQDALFQLTPSFAAQVQRWLERTDRSARSSRDRAFLRRAYLYCQRLGAKNETTSFFGPLIHAIVDERVTGIVPSPEPPTSAKGVEAFAAFWAVSALARALATDPAVVDHVPVRWVPACRLDNDRLVLASGQALRLRPSQVSVASLVDDCCAPTDLAARTGQDMTQVRAVLTLLERAGAVRTWPEPPSTDPRPLDVLIADADAVATDTPWPGRLRAFRKCVAAYGDAPGMAARRDALEQLEKEFTDMSGMDARRAGGEMYADRMVASIEVRGEGSPVHIGADVAAGWERALTPILDLCAHYGALIQQASADLCVALLRQDGVACMPYDELVRRTGTAVANGALIPYLEPADAFVAQLTALVERQLCEGVEAVLSTDELAQLPRAAKPAKFSSPDMMIEVDAAGVERLILGELHPYVFAWGSQALFADDPTGLQEAFRGDLSPWGGADRIATVVRRRRHKGLVAEWFPGRFVEITAEATRDRARTLPITALHAHLSEDQLELRGPNGPLVLYAGDNDHPHLLAFAAGTAQLPLVRLGNFAPRIVVGDVIVQRSRWWLSRRDLALHGRRDVDDTLRCLQRLRVSKGIPRWVFGHVPGEPKPVAFDLDNLLSVETLVGLVWNSTAGTVALAEMRPRPSGLRTVHHGKRVTSEFRIALRRCSGARVEAAP